MRCGNLFQAKGGPGLELREGLLDPPARVRGRKRYVGVGGRNPARGRRVLLRGRHVRRSTDSIVQDARYVIHTITFFAVSYPENSAFFRKIGTFLKKIQEKYCTF